jgi:hypothetical protein
MHQKRVTSDKQGKTANIKLLLSPTTWFVWQLCHRFMSHIVKSHKSNIQNSNTSRLQNWLCEYFKFSFYSSDYSSAFHTMFSPFSACLDEPVIYIYIHTDSRVSSWRLSGLRTIRPSFSFIVIK